MKNTARVRAVTLQAIDNGYDDAHDIWSEPTFGHSLTETNATHRVAVLEQGLRKALKKNGHRPGSKYGSDCRSSMQPCTDLP